MRWPTPDELRRWTAEDQTVLRKWRQAVFTFYGVAFRLLIFTATLARATTNAASPIALQLSQPDERCSPCYP